jgi:hypothetical protein
MALLAKAPSKEKMSVNQALPIMDSAAGNLKIRGQRIRATGS